MNDDVHKWYASLKHGGLLISPTKLAEFFDDDPVDLDDRLVNRLRRSITPVLDGDTKRVGMLLETIFEDILGLDYEDGGHWYKGSYVPNDWSKQLLTGETVRPDWLWVGRNDSALPVFIARKGNLGISTDDWINKRLGIGRSKRAVSRVLEWMRKTDNKLAVLTNGAQLRLVHAGLDYDAFAEADVDMFFEEGEPSLQVTALHKLLGRESIERSASDEPCKLMEAIRATRKGQAELSGVLGERLRRAVELLIRSSDQDALGELDDDPDVSRQDIYIAACRMIMRCVVILFAEARDLLPRDNEIYNRSYSLQGLREQLERQAGGRAQRLRHRYSAWPRILALFDLVYSGSGHGELPITAYGGDLFRPGDLDSRDPVRRATAVFEDPANDINDAIVHRMLRYLTKSRVKVRVGRRNTWVEAPVDFSDLSTEYIGIIYEGLLDFELKRVDDEPMVFLNVGDEPVLPFDRLDGMTDDELAELFSELADGSTAKIQEDPEQFEEKPGEPPRRQGKDRDRTEGSSGIHIGERSTTQAEAEGDAKTSSPGGEVAEAIAEVDGGTRQPTAPETTTEYQERVFEWAKRAVVAAGIVKPPRGATEPEEWTHKFKREREEAARKLVPPDRLFMPGRWYLVRWGGTRKGSGTFYTRPQLAVPTTRRTLKPLVYDEIELTDDGETTVHQVPKEPEEILDTKVCDPAMGSGSFLVAAVRYITDALYESLVHHKCFDDDGERTIIRLADGRPLADTAEDPVPLPPDHEEFESTLRTRLKRYVVERCIYGVDLDPLAVELARMALWIETMDPRLPFGFVDHKIKCGNSLVGCWFDQLPDYPAAAFERGSSWNGGDQNHKNGAHFDADQIGPALKEVRNELMKPALRKVIRAGADDAFDFMKQDVELFEVHDDVREAFERIYDLQVHETAEKERLYRREVRDNAAVRRLRRQLDTWCAIWFWPFEELIDTAERIAARKDDDPEATTEKGVLREGPTEEIAAETTVPLPTDWLELDDRQREIVDALRRKHRFFHWELEFPDVFNPDKTGFDAIIGNPPWETLQPESKEFFSSVDPLYRSYGKQEALKKQTDYFENIDGVEAEWIDYNAGFSALGNWCQNRAHPYGDGDLDGVDHGGIGFTITDHGWHWRDSRELQRMWLNQRADRTGFADDDHPFQQQGSGKSYTYKLFLEMAHGLLDVDDEQQIGGRMGFIVPSGIYTDKGSTELRELFIEKCRWKWLFGFENRQKIFDIDSRFKFCPLIVEKGGQTDAIRAAFMHRELNDWEEAEDHVLDYPADRILKFSPNSKSILELRSDRDLEILTKIYDNGVLLGDDSDDGWGIEYQQGDFNMTSDSHLFPPRPEWEDKGYRPDEYGHWLRGDWRPVESFGFDPDTHRLDPQHGHWSILDRPDGLVLSRDGQMALDVTDLVDEDVALPLYEGRMINQFDFSEKGWVSGKGRSADWRDIPWEEKVVEPQFLMPLETYLTGSEGTGRQFKLVMMDVTASTNTRAAIGCPIDFRPCGHKTPTLTPSNGRPATTLALASVFNSFGFDYLIRLRLGGNSLIWSVLKVTQSVTPTQFFQTTVSQTVGSLSLVSQQFAGAWAQFANDTLGKKPWRREWSITASERMRNRCILDTIVAHFYTLTESEFEHVMGGCDHPRDQVADNSFSRKLNPKGFWRVDKDRDPELRHTVLTQVAFRDLQQLIDACGGDEDRAIRIFTGHTNPDQATDTERITADVPHVHPTDGWMLPERLRLADYGLGHDDRAKHPQRVAQRLGPRFYDWQLQQNPAESWQECQRHAELLEQIVPTPDLEPEATPEDEDASEVQGQLL